MDKQLLIQNIVYKCTYIIKGKWSTGNYVILILFLFVVTK